MGVLLAFQVTRQHPTSNATFRLARSLVVAKLSLLMVCRGNWLGSTQNGERKQWEDQD